MWKEITMLRRYSFQIVGPALNSPLPAFLETEFYRNLAPLTLARELEEAKDRDAAEGAIARFVDRAEAAVLQAGRGFHEVKVSPGKTERSRKISIRCYERDKPDHTLNSRLCPHKLGRFPPPGGADKGTGTCPHTLQRRNSRRWSSDPNVGRKSSSAYPRPCRFGRHI